MNKSTKLALLVTLAILAPWAIGARVMQYAKGVLVTVFPGGLPSADNRVVRTDGTTGTLQDSDISIDDTVAGVTTIRPQTGNHLYLQSASNKNIFLDLLSGRNWAIRSNGGSIGGYTAGNDWYWWAKHMTPGAADTYDLGSSSLTGGRKWRRGWINSLFIGAVAKSSSHTITDTDSVSLVVASGSGTTSTLPTVADNEGRILAFKRNDAVNTVTIDGEGGETIDGVLTLTILHDDGYAILISDGSEWHIVAQEGTNAVVETADLTLTAGATATVGIRYYYLDTTSAAVTVTLPAISAATRGAVFTVKLDVKGPGKNGIVGITGGDTIDGAGSVNIVTEGNSVTIRCPSTGTDWKEH